MITRFIKKNLLYEEIIEHILESIKKGEILPGEKFPPERELEQKWGVSRNVLREAFHILESRGLVISVQGKGRFLRKLPQDELKKYLGSPKIVTKLEKCSLIEIYELRKILEVNAIDLIIERASSEDIQEIEKIYNSFVKNLMRYGVTDTDFKLHISYAKATHNYMLEQIIMLQLKLISEFKSPSFSIMILDYKADDYIEDHGNIIKFIKEKNSEKAKAVMEKHIERTISQLKNI